MIIELPFLSAVALAGISFLIGQTLMRHSQRLWEYYFPEPVVGGLLAAILLVLLRVLGVQVIFPVQGPSVDFLISLLTCNMGLHMVPKLLARTRIGAIFLVTGMLTFFVQLLLALPIAALGSPTTALPTAVLGGPLSLVGAPFNLNPPAQVPPVADLLQPPFAQPEATAQGTMMIGILAGALVIGPVSHVFLRQAAKDSPRTSPADQAPEMSIWDFGRHELAVIVLILSLTALAFHLQEWLLHTFPFLTEDYVPVILLAFFLGVGFRLTFENLPRKPRFPEKALSVLLYGPTMGIVLTYALMSIPLYNLRLVNIQLAAQVLLAVGGSVAMAWSLHALLNRLTDRYYASVVATVFLAVTTGWGPLGMSYLRRLNVEKGEVEPMPAILPVNAFYLFPWMAILLTRLVLG